jgi:hypothetical protein
MLRATVLPLAEILLYAFSNLGKTSLANVSGGRKASQVRLDEDPSPLAPIQARVSTPNALRPLNVKMLCRISFTSTFLATRGGPQKILAFKGASRGRPSCATSLTTAGRRGSAVRALRLRLFHFLTLRSVS